MLWWLPPIERWRSWGPLVATSLISIALLLAGDAVQLPIVRGLRNSVLYPASVVDSRLKEFWDLRGENERLRLALARTTARGERLDEIVREQTRVAELLALRPETSDSLVLGKVVGRGQDSIHDWSYLTVRVSLLEGEGDRPLVAVVPNGLVGLVLERRLGFVMVLSLASARSAVHVVDQRSRVAGVVRSEGGVGSLMRMDHVPAQGDVTVGDTLVTSGQGVVYPPGIPVARVTRVEPRQDELIKSVWVEPFVDFSRLEEVFIRPGLRGVP
jgi:rod shape-determining protein MreC